MKIGILGGGQLARMIALAGYPLGLDFVILDPGGDACGARLGEHLQGAYEDERLLAELAQKADVVTYEFENVPARVAEFLASHTQVHPSPRVLAIAQDRLQEKNFFSELGIPTPKYVPVASLFELEQIMPTIGWPAILKSRTMGYDGKGQSLLRAPYDLAPAWSLLQGAPAIVEAFVPFSREVSIIAARNVSGDIVYYPLSENLHRKGILRVASCRHSDPLQEPAQAYIKRMLQALNYVGVLALELFDVDGQLLANEFAPRVHNSGHWSIEGAETSQFENHLRAILDLPLGATQAVGHSAMVNFIGGNPLREQIAALPCTHLHLYDKAPRKGRKVAHATVRASTEEELMRVLGAVTALAESLDDS
ncbi:MAG: 5-(carboxyamino)imidazole ribonucleotide synthase [Gammaproteobacteria bacterium]